MKTLSLRHFSTLSSFAAVATGFSLLCSATSALAQSATGTFPISGTIAKQCFLLNDADELVNSYTAAGTMTYDASSDTLSTENTDGVAPAFTVTCNSDADVSYEVTVTAAPTALDTSASCALMVNDTEITAVDCQNDTAAATFAVADADSFDGRDGTAAAEETGTINFSVEGNGTQLPAGDYQYDVTLTWAPS